MKIHPCRLRVRIWKVGKCSHQCVIHLWAFRHCIKNSEISKYDIINTAQLETDEL